MKEVPGLICWLDPGLATGWAILRQGNSFSSGQDIFPNIGEMLDELGREHGSCMALGWELYIVTSGGSRTGSAGPPLEICGLARWLGYCHEMQMLKPVPSSMRKVASIDMLKKLGWYKPGSGHANDAARHLLAWLIREDSSMRSVVLEKLFGDETIRGIGDAPS